MKRLVGLFAACAAALGGFAAEGDRVIDGETVTVAAEADLGADVTRVLLRNGGELAFTNSLWVAKTYAVDGDGLNATGVVSVASGQTIVANAREKMVNGTLGHVFVKRGPGTLQFTGGPGVVSAATRWIVEEGVFIQDGGDFFGNHKSTTTNLVVDVREGATYRATGAHCPMGPLELTGGTLDLQGSSTTASWGNTAFRGGVLVHPSATESFILINGNAHLNHVYADVPFTVESGAVLTVRGMLSDGWNDPANARLASRMLVSGGGTLRLFSANSFSGGVKVSDGTTLVVADVLALGTGGTLEIDGDVTLEVAAGVTLDVAQVTGSGTLTKTGAGAAVFRAVADGVTVVRAEGEGAHPNAVEDGAVWANGGVVRIDVPDGQTLAVTEFREAEAGMGGGTTIVKTGAGTLVLPATGNSAAFKNLVAEGGVVRLAAESNLGSGNVTLKNGARLEFSANVSFASRRVIVEGAGGFVVPEKVVVTTPSNCFRTANATFTKFGAGELVFSGSQMFVAPDVGANARFVAEEGTLTFPQDPFGGHTTKPSQVLEIHEDATVVSMVHMPLGRLIMRGGVFRHSAGNMMNQSYTGRVEDRIYKWRAISFNETVQVLPSRDGTPSVIRCARSYAGHAANRVAFDVAEGAVLKLDTRLEDGLDAAGSKPLPKGFVKAGGGELVLEQACGCSGKIVVEGGVLTVGRNAALPDTAKLAVQPGATVRLSDGTSLGAALDAPDAFLATANVWMDATRVAADEGAQVASVRNYGTAGGSFRKFTTGTIPTAPVYKTDGINGLPVLHFNGGAALVLDAYTNRTAGITVFEVARWTSWDYNGGNGGKGHWGGGLSMSYAKATGTDNSTLQTFHTETATTINNTFVQANGMAWFTLSNPNRAVGTPYLDQIVLQDKKMTMVQYTGDAVVEATASTEQTTSQTFNIDLVAIGGRLDSAGRAQYAGSPTSDNNRMYIGDIGELLVFTRKLSDAETARVAAYLKRKWFGSTAASPAADAGMASTLDQATLDVPAGTAAFAGSFVAATPADGAPAVCKTGAGTLSLRAKLSGSGALAVEEGALELSGKAVASRADVWMDAADAGVLTLADGKVTSVRNKGRAGGAFRQTPGRYSSKVPCPTLAEDAINGLSALKFDTNAGLMLDSYTNRTAAPRSVHVYAVMRRDAADVLVEGRGKWGGPFSLVGTSATGDDQTLPGASHIAETFTNIVSVYCGNVSHALTVRAGGLAEPYLFAMHQEHYGCSYSYEWADTAADKVDVNVFDSKVPADIDRVLLGGRGTAGGAMQWESNDAVPNRTWNGVIGEFLVFSSPLCEAEETALLAYLRAKWFGKGEGSATPPAFLTGSYGAPDFGGLGLALASGTSLEQAGPTLALASLEAADDVSWTRDASADPATFALFDVAGALKLGNNQSLAVTTAPSGSAKLFGGILAGELGTWTVTGDKALTSAVVKRGDGVWLRRATGGVIFIR